MHNFISGDRVQFTKQIDGEEYCPGTVRTWYEKGLLEIAAEKIDGPRPKWWQLRKLWNHRLWNREHLYYALKHDAEAEMVSVRWDDDPTGVTLCDGYDPMVLEHLYEGEDNDRT